jgi:hypothetical protein
MEVDSSDFQNSFSSFFQSIQNLNRTSSNSSSTSAINQETQTIKTSPMISGEKVIQIPIVSDSVTTTPVPPKSPLSKTLTCIGNLFSKADKREKPNSKVISTSSAVTGLEDLDAAVVNSPVENRALNSNEIQLLSSDKLNNATELPLLGEISANTINLLNLTKKVNLEQPLEINSLKCEVQKLKYIMDYKDPLQCQDSSDMDQFGQLEAKYVEFIKQLTKSNETEQSCLNQQVKILTLAIKSLDTEMYDTKMELSKLKMQNEQLELKNQNLSIKIQQTENKPEFKIVRI